MNSSAENAVGGAPLEGVGRQACSVDGCDGTPHGRGYCRRCYERIVDKERRAARWKARYHSDEAFRERVKANAKRHALKHDTAPRIAAYQKAHPERQRAWQAAYRARLKERTGVTHNARFVPGRPCRVVEGGKSREGVIDSPACRVHGVWSVWVRLGLGLPILFPTKEVAT